MYVCVCRAITEKQIQKAVEGGTETFKDLRLSLGVANLCGKCGNCAKRSFEKCLQNR